MKLTRRTAMTLPIFSALAGRTAWAQTAETINLAMLAPLTGPYAFTGQRELAGWQDALDYVNADGGAAGMEMSLLALDTEYKVDVGVAQWKKALSASDLHFAKADLIPLVRAMTPENTDRYQMLLSTTANGSHLTEEEGFQYFFIPAPTYSDLTAMALAHIEQVAGAGSGAKIAFVHSNIEFGRDPVPATLAMIDEMGFDLVLEDETAMTGVDVTSSAIKLRNAKPDFILFHGYAGNVWPDVLRLARDYQVDATAMGTIWSVDPDTVKGIGAAADGFIGIVPHTLHVEGNDAPVIQEVEKALKARQGDEYAGYGGIGYMSGWASVLLLREILQPRGGGWRPPRWPRPDAARPVDPGLGLRRHLRRPGLDREPARADREHLPLQRRRRLHLARPDRPGRERGLSRCRRRYSRSRGWRSSMPAA